MLAAFAAVPRRLFAPDDASAVNSDAPIRLPCDQTTSQPSLIALMLEALELEPSDRVLEIGTGFGYEAALLSRLAAEVWTIEWWPELAAAAQRNLEQYGADSVHVRSGDGRLGLPEHAPYDAIVVAAQAMQIPEALEHQLRGGGRLVAPIGQRGAERCLVFEKEASGDMRLVSDLGLVRFVPLLGH